MNFSSDERGELWFFTPSARSNPASRASVKKEHTMTPKTQEFKLHGDSVVSKLKEILHEGDIRRITIKNDEGHTLIEIPLTLGVVGALLLPVWAAIGAIAALAASLTIVVERTDTVPPAAPSTNPQDSV
jgi:hypothetical protein